MRQDRLQRPRGRGRRPPGRGRQGRLPRRRPLRGSRALGPGIEGRHAAREAARRRHHRWGRALGPAHHAHPLQGHRRHRDPAGLVEDERPAQPDQRRLHGRRRRADRVHLHLGHDDPRQPVRRPVRGGRDPRQPLPRRPRSGPLRTPDRRQRVHQHPRERQPLRLPAVRLGRRPPLLHAQLPARQPLPGLLHQGPARADRRDQGPRQPLRAQQRALRPLVPGLRAADHGPPRRADRRPADLPEHDRRRPGLRRRRLQRG